jgi:methionyl aminopeptidase
VTIDSQDDLDGLTRIGQVVAQARDEMIAAVAPGVPTADLDAIGAEVFRRHGARSAPILDYRFPGTSCISVNDEAAHGIPSATKVLRQGDIVNLDVSAELDGYYSDTGASVGVGRISPLAEHLLAVTRSAQQDAMLAAVPGNRVRHIGRAVRARAHRHGFCVIKNLNGHSIGRKLHEPPWVPCADDTQRTVLWEGLVLAIEPFLSVSAGYVVDAADGWTLRTEDGSLVAQFEHTMVVRRGGPLVLTSSQSRPGRPQT